MRSDELLRSSENSAVEGSQFDSVVTGIKSSAKTSKKLRSFSAAGFITAMIVFFLVIFSSGNLIPSAISERLIEETDVQYADAVESKILVFQQALRSGEIPENTATLLKENGVLVGYNNNGFVESNNNPNGELLLKINDREVSADSFAKEVKSDVNLYNAFNNATYSRAAYYYDEAADEVFERIGTTRNNYTDDSEFDDVMDSLIGKGSDININSVSRIKKTVENEDTGEMETIYTYEENGDSANSNKDALRFIRTTAEKNSADTVSNSTIKAADDLTIADTVSKEQRSSLFFLTFMENISKMKAGEGNDSRINEAMNYLYNSTETEVVDTNTGDIIKYKGTPLESPSLYAVLSGDKVKPKEVENFSSERVLKTVGNQLSDTNKTEAITGAVVSTSPKIKGSVGRFTSSGSETASLATLEKVSTTIDNSLVNNSYKTITGIDAGEFLVEGAVNVGKELAKASGGTPGDTNAVTSYNRLNSEILALDAASERINKNPFDVSSKNTFLGSIFYDLAIYQRKSSNTIAKIMSPFMNETVQATISFLPSSFAEDTDGYLSEFGDCETYATINAVGSSHCSEIATFDTTTLNDTFNDPGFKQFVEQNTTLSSGGNRTIKKDSTLAKFILYNNERTSPLGVTDGGILDSLSKGSTSIPFVSSVLDIVKNFLNASESDKRIASGAAFVNSNKNPEWETYKYAQRYVSLARASSALKQYADNSTAYDNLLYFEGKENPVIAFLRDYYEIASR